MMGRAGGMMVLAIFAFVACGRGGGGERVYLSEVEELPPTDSVILAETEVDYIGSPAHITAGPEGTIFVSDAMNSVVHEFSRDGGFVRRFGQRGEGPGEFGTPVATGIAHDSLLVVSDWRESRASVFSLASGVFIRSAPLEGYAFSMRAARGDTMVIGVTNPNLSTSLAKWSTDVGQVDYFGPLPTEYSQSIALLHAHPYTTATLLGDTILFGFSGNPNLFLARMDGTVFDTIAIPAVRRRGVPNDIVQRFAKDLTETEIAGMVSSLVALHRLSDGRVAVVHQDVNFERGAMSAATFLSFLSPDLRRSCPDIPLQFGRDRRPVVTFDGDSLLTLETKLRDGERAENVLLSYDLSSTDCRWVPLS